MCRCPSSTLPDNDFNRAKWHPALLDPKLKLTDEERYQLQEEIDQLFSLGKLTETVKL